MLLKALVVLLTLLPLVSETAAAIAPPLPDGDEIRVSLLENVAHRNPQVAVFPDGRFVIVWTVSALDGHGRAVIHARFFTPDGIPAGGELRLVDRSGASQRVDDVAMDRDGSFLVAWTETAAPSGRRIVFVRRFDPDGTARGKRIRVTTPHTSDRYGGKLAIGSDGRFAVAWTANVDLNPDDLDYTDSVARIFNSRGTPLTREFIVGPGTPGNGSDNIFSEPAAVALGPDGTLTVQLENYKAPEVFTHSLNRYDSKGNQKTSYSLGNPTYYGLDAPGASLCMAPDGRMIAAWSQWKIAAQWFRPDGSPRGKLFRVGKDLENDPLRESPAVALVDGKISVIVWQEADDRDGDGSGIFGRILAADGRPLSDDLQINTTSEGWQHEPAIAAASDGTVVVVWVTDGGDVLARLLTPEP